MKIQFLSQNISNLNFKGKNLEVQVAEKIKKFVNCGMGNLADNLTRQVKAKAPKAIEIVDGVELPAHVGFLKNLLEGIRDLFELPFDLINDVAVKFPALKLDNFEIIKKHRAHTLKEAQIKALQGIYEDGAEYIQAIDSGILSQVSTVSEVCNDACHQTCKEINSKFNKLLNDSMASDKATYDTKKERLVTRLVSGLTAAIFLGNDFFNSAKLKGKTDEEARKSQLLKQGQEVKENILEGLMQFGLLSCFSRFVNSNLWASALLGTAISTVSRIISRKSSKMRLTRVDVPEYSLKEFQKAAKSKKEYKTQSETDKETKKPILSLRNIALFCAASIAGGFLLRGIKLHTGFGKNISKFFKQFNDKLEKNSTQYVIATMDDIQNVSKLLKSCGENNFSMEVGELIYKLDSEGKIIIGKTQKTVKLFGKIEVPISELKNLPLAPFRIIKEVISYPYKIAKNLAGALGLIDNGGKSKIFSKEDAIRYIKEAGFENILDNIKITDRMKKADLDKILEDPYNIKNVFLRYKQFKERYGANTDKLNEEFTKYIKQMRLVSLNNRTVSKVDNSKIAIIAQTTGTLSGMWFNMNDEYNAAVKNGDSKQEAQIAARKRGLNKFARMSSQVAISGALNSLFKRQYQGSMIGAGLIVALSTFLTDIVARQMTAMPTKKMDKEELEKYQENHKKGFMSWYYKLIENLSK